MVKRKQYVHVVCDRWDSGVLGVYRSRRQADRRVAELQAAGDVREYWVHRQPLQ